MKDIPYQDIFDTLQEVLPDDWRKVVFYVEYGENSYSMKYFVDTGNGEYTDCFKLKDISKQDIIKAFAVIDSKIMPVRRELNKKDTTWSVMTIVIDDNGNFKVDYEYSSEGLTEHYEKWKEKYLK